VLDYVSAAPVFDVVAVSATGGPAPEAPGPVQYRIWAPQGATGLTVNFSTDLLSSLGLKASLLASVNQPITFNVATPTAISDDAMARSAFAGGGGNPSFSATVTLGGATPDAGIPDASTPVAVPCGGTWINFAIVSTAGAMNVQGLAALLASDPGCTWADGGPTPPPGVDAGAAQPPTLCQTRDAGIAYEICPDASPGPDAGPDAATADAGAAKPPGGCGCNSAGVAPALLACAAMFGLRRRRRS
jgi:hypothetical protein